MTNRKWQLVYGPIAWIALAFGTIHVLITGTPGWNDQERWPGNLPPTNLTSTMIPLTAMFLKLLQIFVCRVSRVLRSSFSSYHSGSIASTSVLQIDETFSMESHLGASKSTLVTVPPLLDENKHSRGSEPDMDGNEMYEHHERTQNNVYGSKSDIMRRMKEDIA